MQELGNLAYIGYRKKKPKAQTKRRHMSRYEFMQVWRMKIAGLEAISAEIHGRGTG
jgi:hypothetical protein